MLTDLSALLILWCWDPRMWGLFTQPLSQLSSFPSRAYSRLWLGSHGTVVRFILPPVLCASCCSHGVSIARRDAAGKEDLYWACTQASITCQETCACLVPHCIPEPLMSFHIPDSWPSFSSSLSILYSLCNWNIGGTCLPHLSIHVSLLLSLSHPSIHINHAHHCGTRLLNTC